MTVKRRNAVHNPCDQVRTGFYQKMQAETLKRAMSSALPKPGDPVKLTLMNGDTLEGTIEWVDGNGAMIKGTAKTRWVPIETLLSLPAAPGAKKEKETASEE